MQPSFLRGMRQDIHKKEYKKRLLLHKYIDVYNSYTSYIHMQ